MKLVWDESTRDDDAWWQTRRWSVTEDLQDTVAGPLDRRDRLAILSRVLHPGNATVGNRWLRRRGG